MKIVVINGTAVKGITYTMKKDFLNSFNEENDIVEFYPDSFPDFCKGCKNCFLHGEENCPHFSKKSIIWNEILKCDLLVFAYPVYALRVPASIKSLLDHFCVHWMVHRPEPIFFEKTAVIITNSVGAPNGAAQKDVKTSLNWMGLSRIYTCGIPMMGDIFIDNMTEKHRYIIKKRMKRLAGKVQGNKSYRHMNFKVKLLFELAKFQHKTILKTEKTPSLDNAHYIKHGWIK